MKNWKIAIVLGTVCLILTFGICTQIKTVKRMTEEIGSPFKENGELRDEYLKWKSKYDTEYSKLKKAEERLEEVRNKAASKNQGDSLKESELKQNNRLLGLTEVTGGRHNNIDR